MTGKKKPRPVPGVSDSFLLYLFGPHVVGGNATSGREFLRASGHREIIYEPTIPPGHIPDSFLNYIKINKHSGKLLKLILFK